MQTLHSCPSESFSGLEHYALEIAKDQKNKGHIVYFLAVPGTELFRRVEQADIIPIKFNPRRFWEPYLFALSSVPFLNLKKIDIVHIHSTQEVSRFYIIKNLGKFLGFQPKKIVLQCHLWVDHKKKDFLHKLFYSVISEVWCSSRQAKKSLESNLPLEVDKIKIVPYGRNINKTKQDFLSKSEARKQLNLPENEILWGCVSRIEKSKGIEEWIWGLKPLFEKNDSMRAVLIGGVSPNNIQAVQDYAVLQKKIMTLPLDLQKRFCLLGPVNDSHRYLKAFDIYCLPSYQETFSLSLLDAQLAGLPVLGTDSGGTPDVVISQKTGWLAKPRSAEEITKAAERALEEKIKWEEYGHLASVRVERDFNQEIIFNKIIQLYEQK